MPVIAPYICTPLGGHKDVLSVSSSDKKKPPMINNRPHKVIRSFSCEKNMELFGFTELHINVFRPACSPADTSLTVPEVYTPAPSHLPPLRSSHRFLVLAACLPTPSCLLKPFFILVYVVLEKKNHSVLSF